MKKKILDLLFGEEEHEEYYEEVLEKTPAKKIVKQEEPVVKKESVIVKNNDINISQEEKKPEVKKISFDINDIDDYNKSSNVNFKSKDRNSNQKKEYEFSQVISPIFGSSDKDMEALSIKSVKSRVSSKSSVISPMHGISSRNGEESLPTKILNKSKADDKDENMVNLTLDEILSRTASLSGKNSEDKQLDLNKFEEKQVVSNRNMSLFDDE
ncbi:MAG: hypothetical protein ACK5KQ_06840 [Anaerorhabdus sp.]